MRIAFLDTKTVGPKIDYTELKSLGDVVFFETTENEEVLKHAKDADVIITNKVKMNQAILEALPKLKLICVAATGVDNIDLKAAASLDIEVKNVKGYSTESVVQHTFSMLFYLLSHMKKYDRYVSSREWNRSDIFTNLDFPFWEISQKKWGIIGMGTIGKKVATVASAFGCSVQYYSTSGKNLDQGFNSVSLDTLFSSSDIISIHAPLNDKTYNLVGEEELFKLGDGSIILNVGRGGIINEKALCEALKTKNFKVGLDVLENEPLLDSSPINTLLDDDRVLITPHIAWSSQEARARLVHSICQNILSISINKDNR